MTGLDLLLNSAFDYERTHQIVLYTLFEKSNLPELLLPDLLAGDRRTKPTEWEPEGQLFDLGLSSDVSRVLIEIKMWSSLTDGQLKRQAEFLKKHACRGGYVLLGTSWFEFDQALLDKRLDERTDSLGVRLGYEEIIRALNALITSGPTSDVCELAIAYKTALEAQFAELRDACYSNAKDKRFFYSLFWRLKQKLRDFDTAIYTANNPGGPVYILNNQSWKQLHIDGIEVELYCEVVNDRLCIKFWADSEDGRTRQGIRDKVRHAAHKVLDEQLEVVDAGRLGAYMTACQIKHDFSDLEQMDKSVEVFATVGRSLERIASRLGSSE